MHIRKRGCFAGVAPPISSPEASDSILTHRSGGQAGSHDGHEPEQHGAVDIPLGCALLQAGNVEVENSVSRGYVAEGGGGLCLHVR